MAITDPTAIRFSNEKIRPAADELAQAYYKVKAIVDEWFAQSLGNVLTNTSDQVMDGADIDGRPVITGINVNFMMNRMIELVDDYEAGNNAKLNTILQVAVNPDN